MRKIFYLFLFVFVIILGSVIYKNYVSIGSQDVLSSQKKLIYWMILHRKSNEEFLYFGTPGEGQNSTLVKIFKVKTGIPGERPTPLPSLLGRGYWMIIDKVESKDNPETAPYFLTLDIPVADEFPFGPEPYLECLDPLTSEIKQCNWVLPGTFGLHGVNGDMFRLSRENPGSSGCVRHSDQDITYLYNLFDPKKEKIRYYVEDI